MPCRSRVVDRIVVFNTVSNKLDVISIFSAQRHRGRTECDYFSLGRSGTFSTARSSQPSLSTWAPSGRRPRSASVVGDVFQLQEPRGLLAVLTIKALVDVLPTALHQQTQHGPNNNMPSPGGQASGMVVHQHDEAGPGMDRVWHPVDLPKGYHAAPRGRVPRGCRRLRRGLPPGRRAVGLRQVDGMPHVSQRARSSMVAGHRSITTVDRSRSGRLQAVRRRVAARIGEN